MIFGDRQDFAVEVDRFDPPWPDLPAYEDAVWAAVSLWVGGVNITEHRRNGTDRIRDAVHMPLCPLAQWWSAMRPALRFEERSQLGNLHSPHLELDRWSEALPPAQVDEATWFDRRDAWWSRHFTGAATSDVIVPSVGIVRSDDRALVSWRVPTLARTDRSFVRSTGTATVSWSNVTSALSEFTATLSEWSPDVELDDPAAHAGSPLEFYTGLAADELPGFGFWPQAVTDPAVDPLAQVVRDLTHRTATGGAQRSIVEFVRDSRRSSSPEWWSARTRLLPGGEQHRSHGGQRHCCGSRRAHGVDHRTDKGAVGQAVRMCAWNRPSDARPASWGSDRCRLRPASDGESAAKVGRVCGRTAAPDMRATGGI